MRRTILGFSLAGTLLCGIAFALSWLNPIWIERMASTAVRFEVEREAGERIDALSGAPIVGLAQRALGRTDADIERTREAIRRELPANAARVVAAMLDPACACRIRLTAASDAAARQHLLSLSQARVRLASLIETAYATSGSSTDSRGGGISGALLIHATRPDHACATPHAPHGWPAGTSSAPPRRCRRSPRPTPARCATPPAYAPGIPAPGSRPGPAPATPR
jgi:hypothetical protein